MTSFPKNLIIKSDCVKITTWNNKTYNISKDINFKLKEGMRQNG